VRANAARTVGFLRNAQRANVACSRARHSLTVVGSRATLARGGAPWTQLLMACSAGHQRSFGDFLQF
jgi:hypothetical protein